MLDLMNIYEYVSNMQNNQVSFSPTASGSEHDINKKVDLDDEMNKK